MSNVLKLSGALKVGSLGSAPSNPQEGYIYFDTVSGKFQMYQNAGFREIDAEGLELHLDGSGIKHGADEVSYDRADGSKKNIAAGSDAVESALSDLDDAIGALDATPSNYTPADPAIVADHLAAIDSALSAAGGNEFADNLWRVIDNGDNTKKIAFEASGIATATTRTITMPDANVDLADVNNALLRDGSRTVAGNLNPDGNETRNLGANGGNRWNSIEVKTVQNNGGALELNGINVDVVGNEILNVAPGGAGSSAANVDQVTAVQDDVDDLVALSGVAANATHLGTFTGVTIPDSSTIKAALQSLETSLESLPDPMEYKGNWAASTNTPSLADGVGNNGDVYYVTDAGTVDFGAGNITFAQGDRVVYSGADGEWQKWDTTDQVTSVNSQTGAVVLDTDDVAEGSTNKYYTAAQARTDLIASSISNGDTTHAPSGDAVFDALALKADSSHTHVAADITDFTAAAKAAAVADAISNGVTDVAPSQNAVFDALALKLENVIEDTSPELGGDLNVGGFAIEDDAAPVLLAGQNAVRRAKQASKSSFIEEEYIHSTALSASQTDTVIAGLTFAHATYEAIEVTYKIKEATTNNVRIGRFRVVTNGTAVVLQDDFTDSADTGVSFSAVVNGANINVRYSSGANASTLRMDVKKIQA